jgi:hypothetical protein
LEFFAESFSFAQDLLGRALIVPETGLADGGVQFGQAAFLDG